jgi:hypothetical protein
MKKAVALLVVILTISGFWANAQKSREDTYLQAGIKAGAGYSQITDLSKMLVSESYYTGYTFTNSSELSFTGGLYINYKFKESISAFYSELSYSRLGNKLHYSDINELEYDYVIKYDYINVDFWYKAYFLPGLNAGIGPRIGFNLTPGGLFYTSNGEALYGPDIRIQQQMRDVLKGRTNFAVGVSLGYELANGLSIDARYYFGISDVIETEVNNFHFIENKNSGRILQLTIGYAIPYHMIFF